MPPRSLLVLSALVFCFMCVAVSSGDCAWFGVMQSPEKIGKVYKALTDPKSSLSDEEVDKMVNKIREYQLSKPGTTEFTLAGKDMDWLMELKKDPSLSRRIFSGTTELKKVIEKSKSSPLKTFVGRILDLCDQEVLNKFESFQRRNPDETSLISDYLEALKVVKPKESKTTPEHRWAALNKLKSARADGLDEFELQRRLHKACNLFLAEGLGLELNSEVKDTSLPAYRAVCIGED